MRERTIAVLLAGLAMSIPSTTTTAAAAIVRITATRQESISRIPPLKKMKLALYHVVVCVDQDMPVPGGRVLQALHGAGLATEAGQLAPYVTAYTADSTLLGRLGELGETGGPVAAIALGLLKDGPWFAIPQGLALISRLAKDKQGRYLPLILPLLQKLLRADERLGIMESICEERFILAAATGKPVIAVGIQVTDVLPAGVAPAATPAATPAAAAYRRSWLPLDVEPAILAVRKGVWQ